MKPLGTSQETRYRLLTFLAKHPDASQREVARELGVSVGKVNYCLKALIAEGWVKKQQYLYVLTAKGRDEKVQVTSAFLRRKLSEYEQLGAEIERLRREVSASEGGR